MERTDEYKIRLAKKRIARHFQLLFILFMLGACSTPIPPRYQPFLKDSSSAQSAQGYQDIQLDERTYFVRYENYYVFVDRCDQRLLKGAQEYALYRAGELAKSKGAKYFVVLHKDDWNLASALRATKPTFGQKYGSAGAEAVLNEGSPGAGLIIRLLSEYPPSARPGDNSIYDVDELLQNLPAMNVGLAKYLNRPSQGVSMSQSENSFSRWRSSVTKCGSLPVQDRQDNRSVPQQYEPGHTITKGPDGNFQIAIWSHQFWPTTTVMRFLWLCVWLADQRGFEIFKLQDWRVEEHLSREIKTWGAWFVMKATVIPQHKLDLASPEPVFHADAIRSQVFP